MNTFRPYDGLMAHAEWYYSSKGTKQPSLCPSEPYAMCKIITKWCHIHFQVHLKIKPKLHCLTAPEGWDPS